MMRVSLALAAVLVLSACAEPIDPDRDADLAEVEEAGPEPQITDVPEELESDGNVLATTTVGTANQNQSPAQRAKENLEDRRQHGKQKPAGADLAQAGLDRREIDAAERDIEQRRRHQYSSGKKEKSAHSGPRWLTWLDLKRA